MTKGEETRLRNLIAKSKDVKLSDLETLFLNRLKEKQKSELKNGPKVRIETRKLSGSSGI